MRAIKSVDRSPRLTLVAACSAASLQRGTLDAPPEDAAGDALDATGGPTSTTSRLARASRPASRAKSAAVKSFWLRTLGSALAARSTSTDVSFPYRAAIIKGVVPLGDRALTCAPLPSR